MEHSFNIEIATQYGILEAILLKYLFFWISKNEANNQHFYDGRYWTYNSVKAFGILFPYVSSKKIQYALKKLEEEEIIITGNYNKSNYDRTLWYAFTNKGNSIMQNCKIDLVKMENGNGDFVKPIPDNKTQIKDHIYIKEKFKPPTLEEVRDYCLNERHNDVDYKAFYDYYTTGNWTDSKGNRVKNWKQKIITWEKKNNNIPKNNKSNYGTMVQVDENVFELR